MSPDPIYRVPAPMLDEQYEELAGEPMGDEPRARCPVCSTDLRQYGGPTEWTCDTEVCLGNLASAPRTHL